jgi:hypothetical protein
MVVKIAVTLREEYRLSVFENRVLERTTESEKELTGV